MQSSPFNEEQDNQEEQMYTQQQHHHQQLQEQVFDTITEENYQQNQEHYPQQQYPHQQNEQQQLYQQPNGIYGYDQTPFHSNPMFRVCPNDAGPAKQTVSKFSFHLDQKDKHNYETLSSTPSLLSSSSLLLPLNENVDINDNGNDNVNVNDNFNDNVNVNDNFNTTSIPFGFPKRKNLLEPLPLPQSSVTTKSSTPAFHYGSYKLPTSSNKVSPQLLNRINKNDTKDIENVSFISTPLKETPSVTTSFISTSSNTSFTTSTSIPSTTNVGIRTRKRQPIVVEDTPVTLLEPKKTNRRKYVTKSSTSFSSSGSGNGTVNGIGNGNISTTIPSETTIVDTNKKNDPLLKQETESKHFDSELDDMFSSSSSSSSVLTKPEMDTTSIIPPSSFSSMTQTTSTTTPWNDGTKPSIMRTDWDLFYFFGSQMERIKIERERNYQVAKNKISTCGVDDFHNNQMRIAYQKLLHENLEKNYERIIEKLQTVNTLLIDMQLDVTALLKIEPIPDQFKSKDRCMMLQKKEMENRSLLMIIICNKHVKYVFSLLFMIIVLFLSMYSIFHLFFYNHLPGWKPENQILQQRF